MKSNEYPDDPIRDESGWLKLLLPLVLLAAVLFLGWKFLAPGGGEDKVDIQQKNNSVNQQINAPEKEEKPFSLGGLVDGLTDGIDEKFAEMIDGAKESFANIDNEAAAQEASEKLDGLTKSLGKYSLLLRRAPEAIKERVRDSVSKFKEEAPKFLENAWQTPGVEDALKPSLDKFLEKLESISR